MSDKRKSNIQAFGCLTVLLIATVALLYPVFQQVRKNATNGKCASNLMQLGLALTQYTQDNDDKYPNIAAPNGTATWRTATFAYTKSEGVYQDPERDDESKVGPDGFFQDYAANYSGNYGRTQPDKGEGAFAGAGSFPLSTNGFKTPAQVIQLLEVENNDRPEFNIDNARLFGPATKKLWAGHSGGSNYLFADGHVKRLTPLKTYETDSKGKVTVNLWYRDGKKPLSNNGVAVLKDTQVRFK